MKTLFKLTIALGISSSALLGCDAAEEDSNETASADLAEVEGAQTSMASFEEASGGCLTLFADCVAAGEEGCFADLKACAPKPPRAKKKLQRLKEAAAKCKAFKEAGIAGDEPTEEEQKRINKCQKIRKALTRLKAKAEAKPIIGACIEDLAACADSVEDPQSCVPEARQCIKESVLAHFDAMCINKLDKCDSSGASPALCDKIAQRCEEGPQKTEAAPEDVEPEVTETESPAE